MKNRRALFAGASLIIVGMLLGRLLGLLREITLAAQFGTGPKADMAIALLLIPDFITAAFIGSAASAALVPAFAARSAERSLALLWQIMLVSVVAFAGIALAASFAQDTVWSLFSHTANEQPHAGSALFLTLCSLPLTAATWVFTAWLQYRGKLVAPAFANALFNIAVLLVLWFAAPGLVVLALGIIAASLLRLVAHAGAFIRDGGRFGNMLHAQWELKKPLLVAYGQTVSTGIFGMLPLYASYIVIGTAGASVALFNYAFKLALLPAMLLQMVIQMTLLPWLVRLRAESTQQQFRDTGRTCLHVGWAVGVSAALVITLASHPIAVLCFYRGQMSPDAVQQVGALLAVGIWNLPGIVLVCIWQQILYAQHHTRTALAASVLQAILVVPLYLFGHEYYGAAGVLVGYTLIQLLPLPLLVWRGRALLEHVRLVPDRHTIAITLCMLSVFAPLAWLYRAYTPESPLIALVLAAGIGMLTLAAGLSAYKPARDGAREWCRKQ